MVGTLCRYARDSCQRFLITALDKGGPSVKPGKAQRRAARNSLETPVREDDEDCREECEYLYANIVVEVYHVCFGILHPR